jgi:hypothetical protein
VSHRICAASGRRCRGIQRVLSLYATSSVVPPARYDNGKDQQECGASKKSVHRLREGARGRNATHAARLSIVAPLSLRQN